MKSADINAKLNQLVYMRAPCGYLKNGQESIQVAEMDWYRYLEMLGTGSHERGFSWSSVDHSVFLQKLKFSEHDIVAVATNNMAVTSNSIFMVKCFKAKLSKYYNITNLRELHWFLDFKVKYDRVMRTISINQFMYIY